MSDRVHIAAAISRHKKAVFKPCVPFYEHSVSPSAIISLSPHDILKTIKKGVKLRCQDLPVRVTFGSKIT